MTRSMHRLVASIAALLMSACATMPSIDLSQVRFSLDRVSDVHVAGIDVSNIDSAEELNPFQVARATLALSRKELPLELTLHLKSENPAANRVAARLVRVEWTLILNGRDTISGTIDRPVRIPAGSSEEIPLRLRLNMFDFFNEKSAMDMLDLALAFAGAGGRVPNGVALRLYPTIDTPLGPIRYSRPIVVEPRHP